MSNFNLSISARENGTLEAAYIQLSDAPVAMTHELGGSVVVDFDANSNVVGVEILAPITVAMVHRIADALKPAERESFNQFVEPMQQVCAPS
jgi:uncharacterized protein YuzE